MSCPAAVRHRKWSVNHTGVFCEDCRRPQSRHTFIHESRFQNLPGSDTEMENAGKDREEEEEEEEEERRAGI